MRRPALVLIVAVAAAVALWTMASRPALPAAPDEPASPVDTVGGPSDATPQVMIDQQLVRADVTKEPARVAAARKPVPVAKRHAPRKEGFFARARRVLFGGGRHKPSPFPAAQ